MISTATAASSTVSMRLDLMTPFQPQRHRSFDKLSAITMAGKVVNQGNRGGIAKCQEFQVFIRIFKKSIFMA
jgi:hypothetical protein